jgi:hypothetical protein
MARSLHSSKLVTLAVVLAVVATGCAADGADEAIAPPENVATTSEALSLSPYRWSLPWRGGSGGAWTGPLGCGPGDVIVGIHVRAHTYVDQLGLICAHLYSNGTFGPRYTTPAQGGGGGDPYYFECIHGTAVVGFYGKAKTYLDRIGVICGVPRGNTGYYANTAGGDGGDFLRGLVPARPDRHDRLRDADRRAPRRKPRRRDPGKLQLPLSVMVRTSPGLAPIWPGHSVTRATRARSFDRDLGTRIARGAVAA